MKNNFDMSTKGVNLELSVFFNTGLANIECEDNFKTLIQDALLFYTDCSQRAKPSDLSDVFSFKGLKKAELWDIYESLGLGYESEITKQEIIDKLNGVQLSKISEGDFNYVLHKAALKKGLKIVNCRGYSQGDFIRVLCNESDKTDFSKLLYDCPLAATLSIDDNELYFDEFISDSYCYDKDELLKIAADKIRHEKKDYILAWLAENLPTYPDYV